jgi:antitoxin component of MazEF toxin-antitoxin module
MDDLLSLPSGEDADSPASYESLDSLLDRVTAENRHGLVDWGQAVGKEWW